MATLANRDWYIADINGQPLKVRCLSQNYVLGTARVVAMDGVFGEVDAHALKYTAEEVLATTTDEDDTTTIPCSKCGKATTFDPTYGDICYRCVRQGE